MGVGARWSVVGCCSDPSVHSTVLVCSTVRASSGAGRDPAAHTARLAEHISVQNNAKPFKTTYYITNNTCEVTGDVYGAQNGPHPISATPLPTQGREARSGFPKTDFKSTHLRGG